MRPDKRLRNVLIKIIVLRGWSLSGLLYDRAKYRDIGALFNLSKRRIGQIAAEPLRIDAEGR